MQTSTDGADAGDHILVGIGANLPSAYGTPLKTCVAALKALEHRGLGITRRSRWFESAPVPASDQPWFINGVIAVECALDPVALLGELQAVEACFGRIRGVADAARTLDLDLLDYRGRLVDETLLELPHPRIRDRAFVLLPLADVAPRWRHPRSGDDLASLIAALGPDQVAQPL